MASLKCVDFSIRSEYNSSYNFRHFLMAYSMLTMFQNGLTCHDPYFSWYLFSCIERRRRVFDVLNFLILRIDARITWDLPPTPAIGKSHCTTSSKRIQINQRDNHMLPSTRQFSIAVVLKKLELLLRPHRGGRKIEEASQSFEASTVFWRRKRWQYEEVSSLREQKKVLVRLY